jgi:hypothetical protein
LETNTARQVRAKIEDYTRFIYILLALSGFLYIGTLISNHEHHGGPMTIMMSGTFVLLFVSFLFSYKVKKLRSSLEE